MKLVVHTARIDYDEADRVDVTRASGLIAFAPSWSLVRMGKGGKITWSEYTEAYIRMMRQSYVDNRQMWDALLERGEVTLVCFCKNPNRCHRTLLAEILRSICEQRGIEFQFMGERVKGQETLPYGG